jgi:O-antigen ligase
VTAPVAVLALLIPSIGSRLPATGDSVADRLLIWREALRVAWAHPFVGSGPSGFLDAVAAVHDVSWFTAAADDSVLDSPHDVLLQSLVIGGPVLSAGLIAVLVATTVAVVRRFRVAQPERRAVILAAALGAGVLLLVLLTHVTAPATMIPAALLVGAAVSLPRREPVREPLAVRIGIAIAIAAWLGLVSLTLAGESALASGVTVVREGRIDDADADFETAAQLRPWDADTPMIAAEAFTERVDEGDVVANRLALAWADRAHLLAPHSLAVSKALVTVLIADHDLKRADSVLEDLRDDYPLDPWVAYRAGAVAVGRGQFDTGEQLLKLAITLDPQWPEPWLTLVYLYDQQGDAAAAADAREHADALGG